MTINFKHLLGIAGISAITGCAAGPSPSSQDIPAITCADKADCGVKWQRATAWVASNSTYRVSIATDTLIQTMGPLPDSTELAFTVVFVPGKKGAGQIAMTAGCDNFIGCVPSAPSAIRDFSAYVNGAHNGG